MYPHNSVLLELLIEHQWITDEQAESIHASFPLSLSGNDRERRFFEEVLTQELIGAEQLLSIVAEVEGIGSLCEKPVLDPSILVSCLSYIDASRSAHFGVVPVDENGDEVTVVSVYPVDYERLEGLAHMLDRSLSILVTTQRIFDDLYSELYSSAGDHSLLQVKEDSSELDQFVWGEFDQDEWEAEDGPVRQYVHWLVQEAIKRRASDIHLEPMETFFRIRCRVDGVLTELDTPAKTIQNAVISRVKLMSLIDIAEKRLPQDGRFHLSVGERDYDFRVSTIPSTHGEGIVIRILDKERLNIDLAELGMVNEQRSMFERVITAPDGIFLVTGPTGSGKSTTLYAALNHINDPGVKIITVEDPVEYHIEGINQVQVRSEVNMTFATALRAILRQAPNIIMVGEIRDSETAEIAINASLTGHTVFSTLHTNDASSAITRLIDMGAKPFLVAAALRAVIAQRLVRKIPEKHRVAYTVQPWQMQALGSDYEHLAGSRFFRAGHKGNAYHGRLGVFEIFEIDEGLQEVIYQNQSLIDIKEYLHKSGYRNMRHDAIRKALQGLTSLEEVLSVTVADNMSFLT